MSLVTIGMPVYKGGRKDGRLLKRALNSLLKQTFQDFKVVIYDNDSPDDTARIIRNQVKDDPRFSYHRNPFNIGFVGNAIHVLMACESKYFQVLHFDYYLAPAFLEECLKVLEADPAAVIAYSHCQLVDEIGNPLELYQDQADFAHEDPGQRYLNVLAGMGWCTAYHGLLRYEALATYQLRTLTYGYNAAWDNEFLAVAALWGKLVQIPKPLMFRHKDNIQSEGETPEARCDRLYFNSAYDPHSSASHPPAVVFYLPFCNWIRLHCEDILLADLPLDRKDELIRQTVSIILKRYKHMVDYELGRAVNLVLTGDFKKGLAGPGVAPPPKGQYKYLDFVYLAQLVRDLEYAHGLRPDFPRLALARAVVRLELGQQPEALAALETAFKQNPDDQEIQDLRAKLQKVVGEPLL